MAARVSKESLEHESTADSGHSLFFYGTLLHPAVLKRVLGHEGNGLRHQPALLDGYTRHHVRDNTYPAILPWDEAKELFDGTSEPHLEERNVRGSLVTGFSKLDVELLDIFEGDEYERRLVSVNPLADSQPLSVAAADAGVLFDPISNPWVTASVKAHTYVWVKPAKLTLDPAIWSYDTFVRDNLHQWIGSDASRESYTEVDRRRDANNQSIVSGAGQSEATEIAKIVQKLDIVDKRDEAQPPEALSKDSGDRKDKYRFGHAMLPHFCLEKGYVNLNHGSYGSCPRPVFDSAQEMTLKIESKPDHFFRIDLYGYMKAVRESLATFINAAHTDEVVMVSNATHGINVILHNLQLKEGDILIGFNTTYVAISSTLRRYADATPTPQLQIITLTFPTTPEAITSTFRRHIEQNVKRTAGTRVVALIDAIISNPGALLPWEELVQICKENGIVSVVDAAHAIGQIPLDMQRADPDYLVSNCHKWLYTKRSSSILYTPKRNHQSMRWTFPISIGYTSPPNEVKFAEQYEWLGTIDYAPYLSVIPALQFRKELGGEDRIRSYCHGLAREGGSKMAEILGTELMDKDDKFTANMVDVLLPLSEEEIKILPSDAPDIIHTRLLENWHCMSAVYKHNGKIWTRASAQIWIEVSDFEYVARALATICRDLVQEATGSQ